MKKKINQFIKYLNRNLLRRSSLKKEDWLNREKPFSRTFGLDRGNAIDRRMIDSFLTSNSAKITGDIFEIGDDRYTLKYGRNIKKSVVFAGKGKSENAIACNGDLTDENSYSQLGSFDCVIATNVLNFIYDFENAVLGLSKLTKKNGICLVTVAGLVAVSRHDYLKYGDFWRFNDLSMKKLFDKYFGSVEVQTFGNAPLAAAFIMGLSEEEIPESLYKVNDEDFQVLIAIKAQNPTT